MRTLAIAVPVVLGALFLLVYLPSRPVYLVGRPETGLKLLFDERLGWRNIPDDDAVTFGQKLTTNAHGMRGPEVDVAKPPGTRRILVLGDSFAWGFGVADDEVFTHVLEEQLPADSARWQVLNAAVSGWSTDQQYLYLMQEGFAFEPDIVVLALFLANDHEGNATSRMYERNKPVFLDVELELANVPVPPPDAEAAVLSTRADPIALTAAILNRIAAECEERGCAFVPAWFGNYMDPDNAQYLRVTREFAAQITTAPHVRPLDLDLAYASVRASYDVLTRGGADRHWNPRGHAITADLVRRHLERHGLLD